MTADANTSPRCPACQSVTDLRAWTVTTAQAAQHFVRNYRHHQRHEQLKAHIASLWQDDQASLMRCDDCGLKFVHPFVAGDARFYNLAYVGTPDYPQDKWEFRLSLQAIDQLDEHQRRQLRVLEIGAGDGAFVRQLIDRGLPAQQITALEYNHTSLEKLSSLGVQARAVDFIGIGFDRGFDFIFMFQVLEHMDRLDAVFNQLATTLAIDGQALIAVPNADRIDFNEANNSLKDMPPNHLSRWRPAAFERLAARHGLRLLNHRVEPTTVKSFIARDLGYHYLQKSMAPDSLAAASYRQPSPVARTLHRTAVAALYGLGRLPLWLRHRSRLQRFGDSLWVQIGR